MEIIIHLLQIISSLGMLICTGIWFWLWYSIFKRYTKLSEKISKLEQEIYVLQINVATIKESLYGKI